MIHLITLNPAIDEYISLDQLSIGETQYRNKTNYKLGGKATNVATVLKNFDCDYKLVTTTDSNNSFVTEAYQQFDCNLYNEEFIRYNLKVNVNSEITEINDRGQELSSGGKQFFKNYIAENIKADDFVLIAGNPHQLDEDFQLELALQIKEITANLIVDSNRFSFEMLKQVCPLMIKPNEQELKAMFPQIDEEHQQVSNLLTYCQQLVISRGADGISCYLAGERIDLPAHQGVVNNTVGAGDSVVAGYLYAVSNHLTPQETAKLCLATASASVYGAELATLEKVREYYPNI